MRINKKVAIVAGAAAILAGGAGVAAAGGNTDATEGPDVAITGDAALAETGGGKVTGTEVGDEESYYEVEVTQADGSQVDVQLDKSFAVVSSKADHEGDA